MKSEDGRELSGIFPDGQSALMLVCAGLRYIEGPKWGIERYLNMQPLYQARLLIVPRLRGIWRRGLRRAENDAQVRNLHETKSHEWTGFLVTRNQSKHSYRECAKASHDVRISDRGELDRASPQKMCEKLWTLSLFNHHTIALKGVRSSLALFCVG